MTTTRFAPSPTGFLHLGGARTALYNWLIARRAGGQFVLRIEDTDAARSTENSAEQIVEMLEWLGLDWDEGPYFQSQRLSLYREHLEVLKDKDLIYPAFETAEELEAARQLALEEKRTTTYNGPSRHYSREEGQKRIGEGQPYLWRFRVSEEGTTVIPETLMSKKKVGFRNADIGDFAITRPGRYDEFSLPLYNFCCVVDDALMKISHVARGVEHLTNTPKQFLLYQAFDYACPTFTHLPLILKNKKKMSKRDEEADPLQPVSLSGRRDLGYLPEATVNFLALLGWTDPDESELFTLDHLQKAFSIEGLNQSNANFDEGKYLHINAWHLRNIELSALTDLVLAHLEQAGLASASYPRSVLEQIVALLVDRCRLLSDFVEGTRFFFERPDDYETKAANKFLMTDQASSVLTDLRSTLASLEHFDHQKIEEALRAFGEEKAIKLKDISQPLRVSLTGRAASPGIFEVIAIFGKEETLARIDAALAYARAGIGADNGVQAG
ncbi:MAG: glutamate--tRNA ligase [Geminicoccaceae bacterium]